MKKISEKKAWLKVAELWKNPKVDFENDCFVSVVENGLLSPPEYGICACLDRLLTSERVSYETYKRMSDKIRGHPKYFCCNFIWSFSKKGAMARARFCKKMANSIKGK